MSVQTRTSPAQPLLTVDQAAEYLSFQPRTLDAWRVRGCGPKFVRVSARAVRYRIEDLVEWAAERIQSSTAEDSAAR